MCVCVCVHTCMFVCMCIYVNVFNDCCVVYWRLNTNWSVSSLLVVFIIELRGDGNHGNPVVTAVTLL